MKFAFTTCVLLGRSVIEKIYEMGGSFQFLVTLKDDMGRNKSGRVYIDDIAEKYGIPVIKVENVNEQKVIDAIKEYDIDWMFIIGWSQIAKNELLHAPKKGCIGMHPTLLPKGRGRASIPWAILKGLDKTGVTMFCLDEGVDTGGILGQVEIMLEKNIDAKELYNRVTDAHIRLIERYWEELVNDRIAVTPQDDSKATTWPGRHPKDGELSHEMTVEEAERLVRAVTHPYPGAFYIKDGKKVIVWSAKISEKSEKEQEEEAERFSCSDGSLILMDWEIIEMEDQGKS